MDNKDKKGSKKFRFVAVDDLDKTLVFNREDIEKAALEDETAVVTKSSNKKKRKRKRTSRVSKKESAEQIEEKREETSLVERNDKTTPEDNVQEAEVKVSTPKKDAKGKKEEPVSSEEAIEEEQPEPFISEEKAEEKEVEPVALEETIEEEQPEPFISEEKAEEKEVEPVASEETIEEEQPEPFISEEKAEEKEKESVVSEETIKEEQSESSISENNVDKKESVIPIKEKEMPGRMFDEVSETETKKKSKPKFYFSFEERVITLVFTIILLFVISCILILEAVDFGKKETITYDEVGNVSYKICLKDNDYYLNRCLDEGMEYVSSLTDKVEVNYDYDVNFSTEIDYALAYHVVGVTKIYNKNDHDKVLYQNEDLLVEKTDISKLDKSIHLKKNVVVDYAAFQEKILSYMNKYSEDAVANLEVILYLDEPTETRKISSITIPLGKETYNVAKSELSNTDKSVEIMNGTWDTYHSVCASVGIVLLLVDLLILFKTTKFVLNATAKRDKFRARLGQILRDYDRMIVVARDGFISTGDKKVIKVAEFNELLDAATMLQKPIIYSKVNNIKSEFIVEDNDTLYKYVMKESDFSK